MPEGKDPESLKFRTAARYKMKQLKADFKVIYEIIKMVRDVKILKIRR
jgi:hypothetical protein